MSPTMVVSSTTTTFLTDRIACCPSCGFDMGPPLEDDPSTRLLESQARIAELETQVCLLTQRLRSTARAPQHPSATGSSVSRTSTSTSSSSANSVTSANTPPNGTQQQTPRASLFQSGASRISALVYSRSSPASSRSGSTASTSTAATITSVATSPPSSPPPSSSGGPREPTQPQQQLSQQARQALEGEQRKLVEALEREQSLRRAAENRLSATSREVEELSAALFEQANEMVADERRARAKLEERVGELERRDVEKKRRLDRLETAVGRIERARRLLKESDDTYGPVDTQAQS